MQFFSSDASAVSELVFSPSSRPKRSSGYSSLSAQIYLECPSIEAPIESLWELAAQRLQLLQKIDELSTRGHSYEELRLEIHQFIRHLYDYPEYFSYENEIPDPLCGVEERDTLSHFLLRLAFCKEKVAQDWFIGNECQLFRWRLGNATARVDDLISQLQSASELNTRLEVIRDKLQDEDLEKDLLHLAMYLRMPSEMQTKYRVPFEQIPELPQLKDFLVSRFRVNLSKSLVNLRKIVHLAEEQEQLRPLLESLRESRLMYSSNSSSFLENQSLLLQDIEKEIPNMPLCMYRLMLNLGQKHHLKHGARLQLGLFLKGCGMSMEDSLSFWRNEFAKGGISTDQFQKEYSYSIRHHYGKEGKRTSYTPYSCMKIIQHRPSTHEDHGCPYRELNAASLNSLLEGYGIQSSEERANIVQKAQEGHFQVACGMTFMIKHGRPSSIANIQDHMEKQATHPGSFVPSHPNEYYSAAKKLSTVEVFANCSNKT
eukprot:jgi/Galph1/3171/GphlegSOOS_G1828.1